MSIYLQNLNDEKHKELDSKEDNVDKVDRMTFIPEKLEEKASFVKLEGKLCIFERRSLSGAEICRHVQSILSSSEQSCRKPT